MRRFASWHISFLLCAITLSVCAETEPVSNQHPKTQAEQEKELKRIGGVASKFWQAGELNKAADACAAAAVYARQINNPQKTAEFLGCQGGLLQLMGRNREALPIYTEGLRIAKQTGDGATIGVISSNLSALYTMLWETDAAEMTITEANRALPPTSPHLPQLTLQRAQVRAKVRDFAEARKLAMEGIEQASLLGDSRIEGIGWEKLGWILLASKDVRAAEIAFTEAFRPARLSKSTYLPSVYQGLARIRLSQGRPTEAVTLLDQALQIARQMGHQSLWMLHHARGRSREAAGRYDLALEDYRESIRLARLFRQEVLPAASMQPAVDLGLSSVSNDFVVLARRLASEQHKESLDLESFVESEQSKAASLQRMLLQSAKLPDSLRNTYAETLQKLRGALVASLRSGSTEESRTVSQLRAEMAVIESQAATRTAAAGPDFAGTPLQTLRSLQKVLSPTEALLSFHVEDQDTRVWLVTRDTFQRMALPGRKALRTMITAESSALLQPDDPQPKLPGLSAVLLSKLPANVLRKRDWLLSLDETLFGVPWAALSAPHSGDRYLVEEHSFQIIPSAQVLLSRSSPGQNAVDGSFVAVGDPVYNRADSRWKAVRPPASQAKRFWSWLPSSTSATNEATPPLELPRLIGTAKEVERVFESSGISQERQIRLVGLSASNAGLESALEKPVQVLHVATHFLASPQKRGSFLVSPEVESPDSEQGFAAERPSEILIALSLDPAGNLNFLSTSEILSAKYQLNNSLVVLDGCASGKGEIWPGAGLLGMSRAWMTAGARSVVVSHWPTSDDSGVLFDVFYREGRRTGNRGLVSSASALRAAQLAMLHSGTWRAHPRVWASYFVVGRE